MHSCASLSGQTGGVKRHSFTVKKTLTCLPVDPGLLLSHCALLGECVVQCNGIWMGRGWRGDIRWGGLES